MNERFLSELSARLAELAAANPAKDLEKNFRGMLTSTFAKLDLVTREEYDVQVRLLARAKEKLAKTLGGIRDMTRVPQAVWIVATKKDSASGCQAMASSGAQFTW